MAAVTRQVSKIELTLNKRDAQEFTREIREILGNFSKLEEKRRIAEAAAPIVIAAARRQAAISFKNKKFHYSYDTPKLVRKFKAPNNEGRRVGTYAPGNLQRSIIDIASRRRKYKANNSKVIIGPYYKGRGPLSGKARAIFNSLSKIDGYYAHMVYRSAKMFQSKIMIPALQSVKAQVVNEMKAEAQRILLGQGAKAKYVRVTKGGLL